MLSLGLSDEEWSSKMQVEDILHEFLSINDVLNAIEYTPLESGSKDQWIMINRKSSTKLIGVNKMAHPGLCLCG